LKQGQLAGQVIERSYAADEPLPVVRFLEVVAQGDPEAALRKLAGLLRSYPGILNHPYIWAQLYHLYVSSITPEQADDELIKLLDGWVEGMTLGKGRVTTVSVVRQQGQASTVFPHLLEKQGWYPTRLADAERRAAQWLVDAYQDLLRRLGECCRWNEVSRQFREYAPAYRASDFSRYISRKGLVPHFQKAFQEFKRNQGLPGHEETLDSETMRQILLRGFDVPRGRSARYKIACELLATLEWVDAEGNRRSPPATLVDSTLDTLRRHGFFKFSRSEIRKRSSST
jgi:hypothetical protein